MPPVAIAAAVAVIVPEAAKNKLPEIKDDWNKKKNLAAVASKFRQW